MKGNPTVRIVLGVAAVMLALGVLRYKPWQGAAQTRAREKLTVGFLPVT